MYKSWLPLSLHLNERYVICTVEPSELVSKVLAASKEGDEEKIEGLLCGAVKQLRNNRSKPDPTTYLSVMYLAKTQPSFFLSEMATEVG